MNIIAHIGSGTFGDVYKGIYNETPVAIKIQSTKKTEHEVYILNSLPTSPYICNLIHYGLSYIVIPLYACSVYDLLQTSDMTKGIPGDLSLNIIRQVLYACKHLHDNGFIYIDYKVNNVMLDGEHIKLSDNDHPITHAMDIINNNKIIDNSDTDSETSDSCSTTDSDSDNYSSEDICLKDIINDKDINTPKVKLIDYGLTTTNERIGSYSYAINEQASPEMLCMHKVSKSTDIWSIGIMLFNMITNMSYVDINTTASNDETDYDDIIEVLRMQCNIFGDYDKSYIECIYFDETGRLKTNNKCIPYSVSIYEYIHPIYTHDKVMHQLIDIIYKICNMNVNRHSVDDIINILNYV